MTEETVTTGIDKTYSQTELDELLARKINDKGREFQKEKTALATKLKDLEEKYNELENQKSAQSVDELKAQLKLKDEKFKVREKELLETHLEGVKKWNTEKINSTYATLVGDKITFEKDLAVEHLVNHSLLNDDGQIVYKDPKTGDEIPATVAVEQFAKARPALTAGPASGTGLRPGIAPRRVPGKPKAEWTSADYFTELEKEIEKKG